MQQKSKYHKTANCKKGRIAKKRKLQTNWKSSTPTCPSFSASLSEYWLGEARFASIPVIIALSYHLFFTINAPVLIRSDLRPHNQIPSDQITSSIFVFFEYPFVRHPPSGCWELLGEEWLHPPRIKSKRLTAQDNTPWEHLMTFVTWNWVTCSSVTSTFPTIVLKFHWR